MRLLILQKTLGIDTVQIMILKPLPKTPRTAIFSSPLRRLVAGANSIGIRIQLKDGLKPTAYVQWEEKMPEEVCRGFDDDHVRWLGDSGWNALAGGDKASIWVGTVRLCLGIKM
jgi:broad specificity phosphatase PhoE